MTVAAVAVGSASTVRLPVWRDLVREHFVTLDIDADRTSPFTGAVRTSMLGHLRVAEVSSVTQGVRRTDELLRADGARYLQLALVTRGLAQLRQDGRECTLRPGDFALYETDRPFFWGLRGDRDPAWGLLVLTWPRATVRLAEGESRALTARRLDGSGGLGGVVSRTLRDLVAVRPDAGPAGGRLADGLADLVTAAAAALPGTAGTATGGPADLGPRIEEWIAARLDDPALCPDVIAAAHFISTRQLHRVFAGRGTTVSQHIRTARLEQCRRALAYGTEPVAAVARRWGFADPAVFSRAFRAAYGTTPSRYRALSHG
jgi:AraC family transcriptional regulator, positive regulator of tynA and feaB